MRNLVLLLTFFSAIWVSCSTDIEIAGEWENIPVVYAILDPADTIHYIRINRVFLGNQSGYDMALQADSLIYNETLEVKVHVYNSSNAFIRTLTFDKVPMFKDSVNYEGEVVFSVDKHHVYASNQILPTDKGYTYKLVIKLADDKEITSEVQSLAGFRQVIPAENSGDRYNLLKNAGFGVKTKVPGSAGGIQYAFHVHYYEFVNETDYTRKTFTFVRQKRRLSPSDTTPELTMPSNDILNMFKTELTVPSAGVRRFIGKVDFEYYIADDYFAEQIWRRSSTVNSESSPITNLIGGYGLFALRSHLLKKGTKPSDATISAFYADNELKRLGFQSPRTYAEYGIANLP